MQLGRKTASIAALLTAGALAVTGCSSGSSDGSTPTPTSSNEAAAPPVCPLTGLPQGDGQRADRVALAVKIDNIAPALPQAGLNSADVVIEELVEGGLTRLMAIFQCDKAPQVGPIRSARISDADLLALLHGSVLGYSGANSKDMPPIYAHSEAALIAYDNKPQYFQLNSSRPAPHNVFSSTSTLLNAGLDLKPKLDAPPPMFTYGALDPLGKRAKRIYMSWPAASALWTWSKDKWLRTQGGQPDMLTSGEQISATNVVILNVNIASTGLHDVLGAPSPLDVTTGSNKAWVLRDGELIRGTWTRKTRGDEFTLTDTQGHTIALAPGRTWVELLPTPRKPSRP